MTDRDKQEQTETEITYQILSEFLQNTPPNQPVHISDLAGPRMMDASYKPFSKINTPELELHCSYDLCNGDRFFRCINVLNEGQLWEPRTPYYFYVTYQCANCTKTIKLYALSAIIDTLGESHGICYKFGEYPPYGPPVPSRLIKLIGPDRDIFLQGRRCENQGFGIGAFAYYRRVVENQKNRILEKIVEVSEKSGVPQDKIDIIRTAIEENQFRKALDMTKDIIPDSLLIRGQNPMLLLYGPLSQGVHELSDKECLELASSVRVVLAKLSENLSNILKDEAEVKGAVSTLVNYKNN